MSSSSDEACSALGHHAAADAGWETDVTKFSLFNYAWIITAVCVVVSFVLTFRLVYLHLRSFHIPSQQKHVVRILLMVPIYSIDSWLSFRFYWLSVYFDLFRDCYEAIVIYEFYVLLVEYAGGYQRTKDAFQKRPAFKLVVPLCCWQVTPRRGLLRWLNRLTLQYVLIRPFMAVIATLSQALGTYCPGDLTAFQAGYPWITVINLISVTVAMYALVLFYVVAQDELKPYNVVPKFLSIKFIIMMSFWQSVIVAGLVRVNVIHNTTKWTSDNISTGVQSSLICVEMLIVAIWHLTAFSPEEFSSAGPDKTSIWAAIPVCFNLVDVLSDIYNSFFTINLRILRKGEPSLVGGIALTTTSTTTTATDTATTTDMSSDSASSPTPPFASAIVIN